MPQTEIIEILKRAERPMSRSELAKELQRSEVAVSHLISRLVKYKDIKIMEIDRHEALLRYNCKRRMRLYYL